MKTKQEPNLQIVRNKYTAQFKEQASERADKDDIPKVAQDLGVACKTAPNIDHLQHWFLFAHVY